MQAASRSHSSPCQALYQESNEFDKIEPLLSELMNKSDLYSQKVRNGRE